MSCPCCLMLADQLKQREKFIKELRDYQETLNIHILKLQKLIPPKTMTTLQTESIIESKFVSHFTQLVVSFHPDNYFPNDQPTLKQGWRWLKNILKEYMDIKQMHDQRQLNKIYL